jgi:hypothetical protein
MATHATVGGWSRGIPPAKAKTLIDYWAHTYDMGRVPRRLNTYPQFRTETTPNIPSLPMRAGFANGSLTDHQQEPKHGQCVALPPLRGPQAATFIFLRPVCNVHSCR